jgi:hypothetical protein
MPIVHFRGRTLPEFTDLTISNLPVMEFKEPPLLPLLPLGLTVRYTITVEHSQIDIRCDASPYNESLFSWVRNRAFVVLHALVDLHSFTTGVPMAVILDKVVYPDGTEKHLLPSNPHLVGLSSLANTSGDSVNLGDALRIVIRDTALIASLRDLISAIGNAGTAAIDCARAIEGIRVILLPDSNKKKEGWHLLQCKLCLSEDYVKLITKTSEAPRHGDRAHISGDAIDEITKRSWTIMNRFLEFQARGGEHPLPLHEFPLL